MDTNAVGTDDNSVDTLFAATNLIDDQTCWQNNSNDMERSGSKGDSTTNVTNFVGIGWVYRDGNNDARAEIGFVNLNNSSFGMVSQIAFQANAAGNSVDPTVYSSGRDLLFTMNDTVPTPNQQRLYLVRADASNSSIGTPIEISRGTNVNTASTIAPMHLFGDGFRPINGQTSTWVVYTETNFEDATITQPDLDLLVARVTDANVVSVQDADHNGDASANAAAPSNVTASLSRGATRLWLYWLQTNTPGSATDNNQSLFGRVFRMNETASLTNSMSTEFAVNTVNDSDGNGDTDVVGFELLDRDPWCGPQVDNDASFVSATQEIDGDADGRTVFSRTAMSDMTTSPPTVTQGTFTTVITDQDSGWGLPDLMVLEGSSNDGEGIVFGTMQGNNITDDTALNSFFETRPFLNAETLPTGFAAQSINSRQIGSDSPTVSPLPFPQAQQLSGQNLMAIVTPNNAADRDFQFDSDTANPQYAYLFYSEFRSDTGSEGGERWMVRCLDLGANSAFNNSDDRFNPPIEGAPDIFGEPDGQFDDIDSVNLELLSEGNSVTGIFNVEKGDDDTVAGRIMVNTVDPNNTSDAALLSNDETWEISDHGQPNPEWMVCPGFAFGGEYTSGSRVFWVRDDEVDNAGTEVFAIQARRLLGGFLPAE
jgi:hypothetical protein